MSVPQTLYITGISGLPQKIPFPSAIGFCFLPSWWMQTGTILEVEVNALCQITSSFLSQLLVGYSFSTQVEEMLHQVEARYWGHSRKSILVAIKQAHTKWINWSSGHRSPLS